MPSEPETVLKDSTPCDVSSGPWEQLPHAQNSGVTSRGPQQNTCRGTVFTSTILFTKLVIWLIEIK